MNEQDGILRALGRVVVNFCRMEGEMEALIGCLIPTRDLDVCVLVTTELSFKNRAALFTGLMQHHFEDAQLLNDCKDMVTRAGKLEEQRNIYLHSYWTINEDGAVIRHKRTAKLFKGLRRQQQPITEAEINRDADAMKAMYEEMSGFAHRLARTGTPGVEG